MNTVLGKRLALMCAIAILSPLALISANTFAADELVGSDGGSLSVGNSGQAVWSMPIEVPRGINGVAPNLTVSVSTSGGNSSLGVGGGLSGLSSITRCGRTVYQDGYFQAPQYQQSDAYCLDGSRLVLESGTYGTAGSVYRTEIETFQRVRAHGAVAGKGPAYFEVTNRNGATMFYGKRASTQEVDTASGAVAVWKIDQLIDSNTNTLHYHYSDVSGNNEIRLTQITYGGNDNQGVAEHLSVDISYENRPDTSNLWSRGQQYSQTKRVSGIQTRVGNTVAKDYRFSYEQGVVTGASRLNTVQLCAGNGSCYRPTQFEYSAEVENNWVASSLSLPATVQTADGKPLGTLIDINNDGQSDWVSASTAADGSVALSTWLGSSSGWQQSTGFTLPDVMFDYQQHVDGFAKGVLLDINADGWPDYVQAFEIGGIATIQTWRNTASGFVRDASLDLPTALVSIDAGGEVRSVADVVDLNADGLIDVIQAVNLNGTPLRQTWLHQFDNGNHNWVANAAYQAPTVLADYTQGTEGRVLATVQDVNGDGLSDWVQSYRVGNVTSNHTWLNTGQGFNSQESTAFALPGAVALFNYDLTTDGIAEYTFTDLNGDGLPDLSKSLDVNGAVLFDSWIHTGLAWQQDTAYNLPGVSTIVAADGTVASVGGLIDLDSDGQPDFVQSYQTATTTVEAYWVFDTAARSWNLTTDYDLPFINNQIQSDGSSISAVDLADLDHDGHPELINTLTGAVFESQSAGFPGTLIRTVNPLGGVSELTYGLSTDGVIYELAEQSQYPNIAYNAPARVVKTIAASDGIGGMITAHHTYGKARTNLIGQGGLGYQYHAMQDGNTGVEVVTTFHQTYPFAGRVKSTTKSLNTTPFSVSNSEMEMIDIVINGLTTRYPYPSSSVSHTHDLEGNLIRISRSTSEIDGFGNTTLSVQSTFDADDNLVRRTTKQVNYKTPDLTRWLFGLPEQTTSTTFDQASNQTFTNASAAEFFADGKPKNETLEPNSNQWVKKAYTYDGFGNRIASTTTAAGIAQPRTNSTVYSSDGRFPEAVSNTLNHSITTTFDTVLGKPLTVTNANGITKEFVYDGFGTVVKETKAHQDNGATRGRQIVMPKWCDSNPNTNCPQHAVYFIAAFDDEGEAPEIGYYDINGKELRKQTYGFEGKIIVVETEYDANGRKLRVSQPYYKDEETATWTEYDYDLLGREVRRKNAAGHYFYTRYNYLTVETENPGNQDTAAQVVKVTNNLFGQPIESVDADQNVTRYEYDGRGKLIKTTDAHGNIATITYDNTFGRKVAMNDPDLGAWTYEYDALGNLIAQTDANGQRSEMTYDLLNRLVRRVDDIGGAKEEITTWEFSETNSNGDLIGGLRKVQSPDYERTVKYDALSRVIESTSIIGTETFTQRTGYLGTADKVDWIQYPTGLSVRNTYDDYGFPQTVEGIALDYDKYQEYQSASEELNELQRQLEAYKNSSLSDAELVELEEHERQVRRLGKALSDFYDAFENDPTNQSHQDEATRYTDLVDLVQQKITEHENWFGIYQEELDTRYDRIKDDLDRLEEIADLSKPHQDAYDAAKELHDEEYAPQVAYYGGLINQQGAIISSNLAHANNRRGDINRLIDTLFIESQATRYKIPEHYDMSGLERLDQDFECCTAYLLDAFMKTQDADVIAATMNQIGSHATQMTNYLASADAANSVIETNGWQTDYDYWEALRKAQEDIMVAAANEINVYADESNALNTAVKPDLDRINDWLAPLTASHNNVILSFNDRARAYVIEISKQTGSYAKRDDLKSEKFLQSFKHHVDYIQCLRDENDKTTGECYAENLIHKLNEDGTVNVEEQDAARADVEDDALVSIDQFWSTNRFFCPVYYGYSCPEFFGEELKQLTKSIHANQCARMTVKQQENSAVPCEQDKWDDVVDTDVEGVTVTEPKYSYLVAGVADITNDLSNYYATLVASHQSEVERLVSAATQNAYDVETDYHDIIQPGGNLWQANLPAEVDTCETASVAKSGAIAEDTEDCSADPRSFVLLHEGNVQQLAFAQMNELEREAILTLKEHQYAVAELINDGASGNYESLYLAVQEKAAEAERLYNEIDQAYAAASVETDFDEAVFNTNKKIYWQAEDINSKGQILKAKYGNGTVTEWSYDQFGRINGHFTVNDAGETLLNNSYEYDAIGNLTQRVDYIEDLTEDFSYDQLNRLVQNNLTGTGASLARIVQHDVVNYDYDELGNITYKSDISGGGANGQYSYGSVDAAQHAGPHAVTHITGLGNFTYDNNGNQLTGNGRSITYNAFNKPVSIFKNNEETKLWYGPERQLVKQQQPTPDGLETTVFVNGLFEQVTQLNTSIVNRHTIAVAGHPVAVLETAPDSLVLTKESYLHKNHQSSILAITGANGDIAERRYYDAFGDIKSYVGQASNQYATWLGFNSITSMAFTGHKTLIAAGVIHMGGRVYDATIGRFLSADPHIQSPLNSQSLNRYSYTLNNPLSWTDPSGYFFSSIFKALKKLFNMIMKIVKQVLNVVKKVLNVIAKVVKKIVQFVKKYWRVIVAVAVVWFAPQITAALMLPTAGLAGAVAIGAVAGGLSGLVMTGSLKGMLQGAFFGAVAGGIAHGIGSLMPSTAPKADLAVATSRGNSAFYGKPTFAGFSQQGQKLFTNGLTGLGKLTKSALHGLGQGVVGKLKGGSFSKSFVSTFISNVGTEYNLTETSLGAGVVGGVAAELSGGDFGKGFFHSWAVAELNHNRHRTKPSLVKGVKVYRKEINIGGQDKYGHWWIEINGNESYGWWPKNTVDLEGTVFGVDGELNGQTNFGGTPTLDPHHGDRSSGTTFDPHYGDKIGGVNVFDVYSTRSRSAVIRSIRDFATNYSGSWSWPFGQNCHSFQEALLDNASLTIRKVR